MQAWQLADALALEIYDVTRGFPKYELSGLTAQMRHAAVSVPARIVNGSVRQDSHECLECFAAAAGFLAELGYYLSLAHRLNFLSEASFQALSHQHELTTRALRELLTQTEPAAQERDAGNLAPQAPSPQPQ